MSTAANELTSSKPQVLVVDDEAGMRTALEVSFARGGWRVDAAGGKNEALAQLRLRKHSLVVTDIRMPDGSGFEVMQAARQIEPEIAVILLTAFGSVPDAVAAMKSGACEYLVKPVPLDELLQTAERVCAAKNRPSCEIVGSSPSLLRALDQARQAARSNADILIEAESGTGKELVARMIHSLSGRRDRPFIAINCAGFPDSLLESELFGHARGAFTGAETAQSGKFQLADGGTLLLDEIAEMPLNLQPKLLRALEEREFYRLGEQQPVKVNIRVVATSNRPLAAMVSEGRFRADLYYRLNVVPLSLPPLRERREDIRELAKYFARKFSAGNPWEIPEALFGYLEQQAWPGNVRQLANFVHAVLALGITGTNLIGDEVVTLSRLTPSLGAKADLQPLQKPWAGVEAYGMRVGTSLQSMEKQLLEMTLDATQGNRSRAAEMLGVSLRTVRNKIREYNLPPRRQYAQIHD